MIKPVLVMSVVGVLLASVGLGRSRLTGAPEHPRRSHAFLSADSGRGLLAAAPAPVSGGAGIAAVMGLVGAPIDLVYALRGGGTSDFWQYSISKNLWTALPSTPAPVGNGGSIVEIASFTFCAPGPPHFDLAALRGADTTDLWLFDISANTWCTGPHTLAPIGPGAAIAQLQGEIYVLRGGGSSEFWKMGQEGRWTPLASTPGPVDRGGGLVGINYGTRSSREVLYALQGGGSTVVWKYDVATDTWAHQADVPGPVGPGGAITSPNYGDEGTLDVLQGGGSSAVWSLDLSTNAWSPIGGAPGPVMDGGANSDQFNGCDFAFVGGGSTQFFSTGLYDCQAVPSQPHFFMSFQQAMITGTAGTKIAVVLDIFRSAGFTGKVTVSPPVTLPRGVRLIGDPVVVKPDGQASNFGLKVKRSAQPGTYALVFVGVDASGETHNAPLTLVVQ